MAQRLKVFIDNVPVDKPDKELKAELAAFMGQRLLKADALKFTRISQEGYAELSFDYIPTDEGFLDKMEKLIEAMKPFVPVVTQAFASAGDICEHGIKKGLICPQCLEKDLCRHGIPYTHECEECNKDV